MNKLKLAVLLAASALTSLSGGAALAQTRPAPAPQGQQAPRPHHDMIDLNKDGVITKDEWMKAAAARFERFDVSKDGKLSREEMRFGRFEEMRMHRSRGHGHVGPGGPGGRGGWQHGPNGGPQGGPGHRMGPPPPPADAPAPAAPSGN
ncbi:hypothetical protein [Sphingomonas sp. KR3-1]|uniref:hypothetical protein n=1 Tax=Sphingomonas sp. KR3-1 TaxID=3156611 RepID=UPI0032B52688